MNKDIEKLLEKSKKDINLRFEYRMKDIDSDKYRYLDEVEDNLEKLDYLLKNCGKKIKNLSNVKGGSIIKKDKQFYVVDDVMTNSINVFGGVKNGIGIYSKMISYKNILKKDIKEYSFIGFSQHISLEIDKEYFLPSGEKLTYVAGHGQLFEDKDKKLWSIVPKGILLYYNHTNKNDYISDITDKISGIFKDNDLDDELNHLAFLLARL